MFLQKESQEKGKKGLVELVCVEHVYKIGMIERGRTTNKQTKNAVETDFGIPARRRILRVPRTKISLGSKQSADNDRTESTYSSKR